MLSKEAISWLNSVKFRKRPHEERLVLIKAAKILHPEDDEQQTEKAVSKY